MQSRGVKRKLAAILAADIAGYSRLMGADEEGMLARLKAVRRELVEPATAQAKGRIVKTTGDGILIEFASVVDAVRCAIQVQQGVAAREADNALDQRIQFRIGVHLGDVMADEGDLYGDGVNVAARLEGLCEPGGILLSRAARDQVRDRLPDLAFEDTGEHQVKNIVRPVRAYRVRFDNVKPAAAKPRRPARLAHAAGLGLVLLVVAGVAIWWAPWTSRVEAASLARMAFPLPQQPSLAVLPFDNLSGDLAQDFIGDGLSDDIIGALANLPELFVIARNSTFTYKGRPVKVQQVAEELGVRYVLEGSVQRSGERMRVTARLVDALSGRQLWSERLDRTVADLFAVKDEITLNIIAAIGAKIGAGEWDRVRRRETSSLEAWLLARQGFESNNQTEPGRARELFSRALEIDPGFVSAYVGLASAIRMETQVRAVDDPTAQLALAEETVGKALALDPSHSGAHVGLSAIQSVQRQYDQAVASVEKALALGPNNPFARGVACMVMFQANQYEAALENCRLAFRLAPNHRPHWMISYNARGHFELGPVHTWAATGQV